VTKRLAALSVLKTGGFAAGEKYRIRFSVSPKEFFADRPIYSVVLGDYL
jgi:hypothetical protein